MRRESELRESNRQWGKIQTASANTDALNRQSLAAPPAVLQAGDHLHDSPPSVKADIQIRPEDKTSRNSAFHYESRAPIRVLPEDFSGVDLLPSNQSISLLE